MNVKQFCRNCGRVTTNENRCQECGVLGQHDVVSLPVERHDRLSQLSDVERSELHATLKEIEMALYHRSRRRAKPRFFHT